MMVVDKQHALDDQIIHLTEDNMTSLRYEVSSVRGALRAKFPEDKFQHILPNLDPDRIIPEEAKFEEVIGPPPESNIYGAYGWTMRADRIPHCIFLTQFIGIQVEVETPFIEELLLWVQKINNNEDVPCRNSQWRHNFFQKRRDRLKQKLGSILQKEIMDLIMVTQHFKNGSLAEEAGFFSFYAALFQRKMLDNDEL
ncbi:expressed unknown protein [Seminavis robusta]|uniref:Uncharacterized protein n=1 Tax=Seminavis robusta TaxID=568900 RepID=A0A9N8H5I9_9STRA|nr:expressed unknown protein [Seminavis robusta]|eukprot:Sro25_g016720.1 n/a (197) ;mRNA; r:11767-12357